ncbi:hypothetical protein ACFP2T_24820 [Plantactinospora solaniradicis]|uniref:Uncharacterized protein n=1 Tax=Plantactinospora solaniradicis TaxID=1723736 RepID=A0ABW1KGG0_9ACTN
MSRCDPAALAPTARRFVSRLARGGRLTGVGWADEPTRSRMVVGWP